MTRDEIEGLRQYYLPEHRDEKFVKLSDVFALPPCACRGAKVLTRGWLDRENGHIETEDGKGLHLRLYLRNDSPMSHIKTESVIVLPGGKPDDA